jgi:FlaA1/EpsC-like NDP-sugar epimerase
MLELNPWQTIQNNLYGSRNVMQQCIQSQVEQFVLVSTDKAVRSTNVMGASKRICELVMQSLVGNGTDMMAVRFGNVVGSSGSVIPLFRDQIAMGGPVTVSHPEALRYFMTIPEACQLILQAVSRGRSGEIFVLKMGTPVKIADMARDLIRLSGKEPDQDIEIKYIGLRPGEKLYEEIAGQGEDLLPTDHDKITVIRPNQDWNGHESQDAFCSWLNPIIQDLYALAEKQDGCGIRDKLKEIVPDYTPQENECVL